MKARAALAAAMAQKDWQPRGEEKPRPQRVVLIRDGSLVPRRRREGRP